MLTLKWQILDTIDEVCGFADSANQFQITNTMADRKPVQIDENDPRELFPRPLTKRCLN